MTNLVNAPISKTAHDNAEADAPWDGLDACWTVLAACGMADWGEGALATVSFLEGGSESHATYQADGEGGWAEVVEY